MLFGVVLSKCTLVHITLTKLTLEIITEKSKQCVKYIILFKIFFFLVSFVLPSFRLS